MNNESALSRKEDEINRFVSKDNNEDELSPFDPPDAYDPQNIEPVEYEKMHPFLQKLVDEHQAFTKVLNTFEEALINWEKNNWVFTNEINSGLKQFFNFLDENVLLHNQKEEKNYFHSYILNLLRRVNIILKTPL